MTSKMFIDSYVEAYKKAFRFGYYVKRRLDLDMSRAIRYSKLQGKAFFSIRIKEYESLINKMEKLDVRKGTPLSGVLFGDNPVIKDFVGIRFVCMNDRTAKDVIETVNNHGSLLAIPGDYYLSSINDNNSNKLARYIKSIGFDPKHLDRDEPNSLWKKRARRYEDINLHLYYHNVRDIGSGLDSRNGKFSQSITDTEFDIIRRQYINALEKNLGDMRGILPEFPIEMQVVTFPMYIYNESQRPEYEILKRPPRGTTVSDGGEGADMETTEQMLDGLKFSLSSVQIWNELLLERFSGPFIYRTQISLKENYSILRRLPPDIDENLKNSIEQLNILAGSVTTDGSQIGVFSDKLRAILNEMKMSVIIPGDYSKKEYFKAKKADEYFFSDDENVRFWIINRAILLILSMIAGFCNDRRCIEYVKSFLEIEEERTGAGIMNRICQEISEVDKICASQRSADINILHYVLDPFVKWRQATACYQDENYPSAALNIAIALEIYDKRFELGLDTSQEYVPSRQEFELRKIEYEWVTDFVDSDISPAKSHSRVELLLDLLDPNARPEVNDRIESYRCLVALQGMMILAIEEAQDWSEIVEQNGEGDIPYEYMIYFLGVVCSFVEHVKGRGGEPQNSLWWHLACATTYLFNDQLALAKEEVREAIKRQHIVNWHPPARLQIYSGLLVFLAIALGFSIVSEKNEESILVEMLKKMPDDTRIALEQIIESHNKFEDKNGDGKIVNIRKILKMWIVSANAAASHATLYKEIFNIIYEGN
ncbi:MAG: hypothetical protein RIB84_29260 [Sneathiellaceae bacterium]